MSDTAAPPVVGAALSTPTIVMAGLAPAIHGFLSDLATDKAS
jgi:hypothetical protein